MGVEGCVTDFALLEVGPDVDGAGFLMRDVIPDFITEFWRELWKELELCGSHEKRCGSGIVDGRGSLMVFCGMQDCESAQPHRE